MLGLVFIYASYDKILHPAAFARIINNYKILPNELVNLSAIFLPWLELIIGCLLLSGIWLPGAVFISYVLLMLFFCMLIYNKVRGLDVNCGCFSTGPESNSHSNLYIIRDFIFVIIAGYLTVKIFTNPSVSENSEK